MFLRRNSFNSRKRLKIKYEVKKMCTVYKVYKIGESTEYQIYVIYFLYRNKHEKNHYPLLHYIKLCKMFRGLLTTYETFVRVCKRSIGPFQVSVNIFFLYLKDNFKSAFFQNYIYWAGGSASRRSNEIWHKSESRVRA